MKKIPTLFLRSEDRRYVTNEVNPNCAWVLDGEGVATYKWDGTCVLIDNGSVYMRREVKPQGTPPAGFIPVETDEVTGKTVGWEPLDNSSFKRFVVEALTAAGDLPDGTYELIGPKINGNPEGTSSHVLVSHDRAPVITDAPRTFDGLSAYLAKFAGEGIVWHHPNGRMAKLKRRDFPTCKEKQ